MSSKVLILGSGPIVIGQAAEFDYAGTQACKALREEGIETVLLNSNPATIMTDPDVADIVYIEPLTVEFVDKVIERERPDGILATLGGQTALNLAVELGERGTLERFAVRVLGTPLSSVKTAEDRSLFKQLLTELGEPTPPSITASQLPDADLFLRDHGLPAVIRPAFTLGGTGGGIARTEAELQRMVDAGLAISPIHQVLIEKYLHGWKEIEYEVMRDAGDTCITICNMENIDPMGVHTGDSIVVAPSQTLTDKEYQMLRSASLRIIRALGIEGGCNIQFALDPDSFQYYVIEVNPRVSRSSALASKATGYPIARVAAKIAIGKRLHEIANAVTQETTAAFEPALDYCVIKIPRWPFDKFPGADRTLGTQMKATGEVMAIDTTFEGALQKAVRGLGGATKDLSYSTPAWDLPQMIERPNDLRLWAIFAALRQGWKPQDISQLSGIDQWFISRFASIVVEETKLLRRKGRASGRSLSPGEVLEAKLLGFSDKTIADLTGTSAESIREIRLRNGIRPTFKMVDTCAAEFDARTPYFYSTYQNFDFTRRDRQPLPEGLRFLDHENEALPLHGDKAVVLGSGPIQIGQGIEFDYCSVHGAWALRELGVTSIMLNNNPETVSTDFDTSDRLYFEPLDEESVLDVLENESDGQKASPLFSDVLPQVMCQFGGQTAINLVDAIERDYYRVPGVPTSVVDQAEDRERFSELLRELNIPQPPGGMATTVSKAAEIARDIGYPVLVRPSYVLGGRAMEIVYNRTELEQYLQFAIGISPSRPVLVDKYIEGIEVEVDLVCDGSEVLIPGLMEHVERAGVHSGDSMAIYPPVRLNEVQKKLLVEASTRIALGLGIKGLLNIQYVVSRDGKISVLEANPRASRTVPFLSKVTGIPIVRLATVTACGKSLRFAGYRGGLAPSGGLWAVKAPVFSMSKLPGADTHLGPEMKSTGEVMGIDRTLEGALAKALRAAGMDIPREGRILASIHDDDKVEALRLLQRLDRLGYELVATEGTARLLRRHGIAADVAARIGDGTPDVVDIIRGRQVQAVINTVRGGGPLKDGIEIRRAAVETQIPCFTSLDTARALVQTLEVGALNLVEVAPLSAYLANVSPHVAA